MPCGSVGVHGKLVPICNARATAIIGTLGPCNTLEDSDPSPPYASRGQSICLQGRLAAGCCLALVPPGGALLTRYGEVRRRRWATLLHCDLYISLTCFVQLAFLCFLARSNTASAWLSDTRHNSSPMRRAYLLFLSHRCQGVGIDALDGCLMPKAHKPVDEGHTARCRDRPHACQVGMWEGAWQMQSHRSVQSD